MSRLGELVRRHGGRDPFDTRTGIPNQWHDEVETALRWLLTREPNDRARVDLSVRTDGKLLIVSTALGTTSARAISARVRGAKESGR